MHEYLPTTRTIRFISGSGCTVVGTAYASESVADACLRLLGWLPQVWLLDEHTRERVCVLCGAY